MWNDSEMCEMCEMGLTKKGRPRVKRDDSKEKHLRPHQNELESATVQMGQIISHYCLTKPRGAFNSMWRNPNNALNVLKPHVSRVHDGFTLSRDSFTLVKANITPCNSILALPSHGYCT